MVDRQIAHHLQMYRQSGAELIMGSGNFLAAKTLEVKLNDGGTRVLEAMSGPTRQFRTCRA
jgi:pyruvate/2-oxoglutarate dehydrogenase complex dihydrolipoamide dehydrogenase (E3) component